jgi:hypothetical protein
MPLPLSSKSRSQRPEPFPTRGVPGGWRDRWESDPADAVLAGVRNHARRRVMTVPGLHLELVAEARDAGRWEAHVTSWRGSDPAPGSVRPPITAPEERWPSVNGPSALVALDALEAELRDLLRGVLSQSDPTSAPPVDG